MTSIVTPFARLFLIYACLALLHGCSGERNLSTFPTRFEGVDRLEFDSNDVVRLLKGKNLSRIVERNSHYRRLIETRSFGEMAIEFVHLYRIPFQLEDPKSELRVTRIQEDDLGFHQVRLTQSYKDIPIWNSELILHFDRDAHVYLVQGHYIRTPTNMSVKPKLTLAAVIEANSDQGKVTSLKSDSDLTILPLAASPPRLVYGLRSKVSLTDESLLLVDADTAIVLRKLPMVHDVN